VDGESGLLASISDPLSHTVSYQYRRTDAVSGIASPTNTVWVTQVSEPASNGPHIWDIRWVDDFEILDGIEATSNGGLKISVVSDQYGRKVRVGLGGTVPV